MTYTLPDSLCSTTHFGASTANPRPVQVRQG